MKIGKTIPALIMLFILSVAASLTVSAGTYTVIQYMGGSFTAPIVTVTNSAGGSITANAFKLNSSVTNVTSISGYLRLDSVDSGSSLDMTVFYSMDGTNFYEGTTANLPLNTQTGFTINFSSTKTIAALFVIPTSATWPGYGYTIWTPCFTRLLTDTTAPTITLSQQNSYSNTGVTVTASISDSESGISVRKWASGYRSSSYFTSGGTSFYSTFTAIANGYYSVYAQDRAGNTAVKYIYVTKIDTSPPTITATTSSVWATSNTITVNIFDSQSGVSSKKWAYGNYAVTYFDSSGTTLTGTTITVSANGTYTIYAKDAVGNAVVKTVTVSYVDSTVSVTHPITVDYSINPNSSTPFTASDITLTNNAHLKVSVSVQQLAAVSGGTLTFTDVTPGFLSDWNSLNAANSTKYIALAIQVKETSTGTDSWYSINAVNPIYAANITSKTLLGVLNPEGASGCLSLSAKHGLAFDGACTARHSLVLIFDIAE